MDGEEAGAVEIEIGIVRSDIGAIDGGGVFLRDVAVGNTGHVSASYTIGICSFRAVYAVRVADAIHVLHAFQKKSKAGIATPQPDVDLIEKRLKAVLARYGLDGR